MRRNLVGLVVRANTVGLTECCIFKWQVLSCKNEVAVTQRCYLIHMGSVEPLSEQRRVRDFGQFLVSRGRLDLPAVERTIRWHEERAEGFLKIVTSLGLIPEREAAELLAQFLDLHVVRAEDYPNELVIGDELGPTFLRDASVLPIAEAHDELVLAMADPLDEFPARALSLKYAKKILPRVAVLSELESALDRLFTNDAVTVKGLSKDADLDGDDPDDDAERLKDLASGAPVIRLVNFLIRNAAEVRASDIHIEPFHNRIRVRYRIDGVLHDRESPPVQLRAAMVSRIKIMARLNIAERRLPQDGRINLVVQGREIDIRVSTIPTMHGESVVLRLLDGSNGVLSLSELGFASANEAACLDLLRRPNGIVLVTGPTGSGKTTTLYAALEHINAPASKIITVEDPVEYQLAGVNQVQVKHQIGLTFAQVLRSVLRQDPDTIMIGEIRDLETAQIAVQASLTGHLVLSTLHTNSASATVTRLMDMGLESYLLAATLSGVVAQRLVRKLCTRCREPYDVAEGNHLGDQLNLAKGSRLYRPIGCAVCNGTGYAGRSAISEVLVVDETIRTLVVERSSPTEISEIAQNLGMQTLYRDAIRLVQDGTTSIDEALRVSTMDH